ncbi:hypothetical protein BCK_23225 [Bacillus cereus FRI-35]|uniref:Uncharacterized protein n=1 Tax=Bacillus pacificus TaxID=2026187 RepID=A0A1Y6AH61_9BACI|nr:hypothetical protein BCK_23225 [Bacillus cereus FRI-35]SME39679.1 hypothetical protein BACERE00191_05069 [Bacillus pacificus]
MFPTIDIVWYAVNTGLEEKQINDEGIYVAPIGFIDGVLSTSEDVSHFEAARFPSPIK